MMMKTALVSMAMIIMCVCCASQPQRISTDPDVCVRYQVPNTLVRYYCFAPDFGHFYPGTRRGGQDIVWTNVPPLTSDESLLDRDMAMGGGRVHYLINLKPITEPAPEGLKRVTVPEAQCRQVVNAMAQDIADLKTGFVELANFSATNPVVMGNVIREARQVQDLRITYFHNFQYVKGKDKTQGNHQPNPGGCIINIQLFPDGGSWAGFRSDEYTRNLDRRSEKTGVRLQASIQTQNKELANRLEAIVKDRFKALE